MQNKTKLKEASNPNTESSRLETLAKDKEWSIKAAVAANPNTNLSTLFVLWRLCPNQFLQNPLLPKLRKVKPDFLHKAPKETFVSLLSMIPTKKTPLWLLESATRHPRFEVRRQAANDPDLPASILGLLSKDKDHLVRMEVAKHPKTPAATLVFLTKDKHMTVRCVLAQNPNASTALLKTLSKDTHPEVRLFVASHPKTPSALLRMLSQDKFYTVRANVAKHPKTPKAVLRVLSQDSNKRVGALATKALER